jgi:hypothetical protein
MAGVKGRSGRRTTSVEDKRKQVIDKAWEVCFQILTSPDTTLAQKADIAKAIVVKNIPQEIEGEINFTIAEKIKEARTRLIQPKPSMN